jgi:hypothetical protein
MKIYRNRYNYKNQNILNGMIFKDIRLWNNESIYPNDSYLLLIFESQKSFICVKRINPIQLKVICFKNQNIDAVKQKVIYDSVYGITISMNEFSIISKKNKSYITGLFTFNNARLGRKFSVGKIYAIAQHRRKE